MTNVFGTNQPDNGVFDLPDLCGGKVNGFYTDIPMIQARCDFSEDGGGWMVILRRKKDVPQQVNFNRSWADYETGFGDLETEFWYGLRNIHCLTTREDVELQIEVKGNDGTGQIWTYDYFKVDGPTNNYTLHIGQAGGPSDGYNSMAYHNGMQFTTRDRDNDKQSSNNCANNNTSGGWWYKSCARSVLTGGHANRDIYWSNDQGDVTYSPYAEMKLRPKKCKKEELCILTPPTNTPTPQSMTPPTNTPTPQSTTPPTNTPTSQSTTPCGLGWRRGAFLNMTNSSEQCPSPWTLFTSGNKRMCFRSNSSGGSCDSAMFNVTGNEYSQVCGRIIGYQYGHPLGFYPYHAYQLSIETYYIEGLSVTHGQSPRKHIWTFAAGNSERDYHGSCPCGSSTLKANIPPYIGNNYFCETGTISNPSLSIYSNDPLWDGEGCGSGHSCECTLNSPPWFTTQLVNSTNDNIEVRSCGIGGTNGRNIGIELIELYVK